MRMELDILPLCFLSAPLAPIYYYDRISIHTTTSGNLALTSTVYRNICLSVSCQTLDIE